MDRPLLFRLIPHPLLLLLLLLLLLPFLLLLLLSLHCRLFLPFLFFAPVLNIDPPSSLSVRRIKESARKLMNNSKWRADLLGGIPNPRANVDERERARVPTVMEVICWAHWLNLTPWTACVSKLNALAEVEAP